jgi:hypothetical protein
MEEKENRKTKKQTDLRILLGLPDVLLVTYATRYSYFADFLSSLLTCCNVIYDFQRVFCLILCFINSKKLIQICWSGVL